MEEITHGVNYHIGIEKGTVLYYPDEKLLLFGDIIDRYAWLDGTPMKLRVLWTREAIPPNSKYRYK